MESLEQRLVDETCRGDQLALAEGLFESRDLGHIGRPVAVQRQEATQAMPWAASQPASRGGIRRDTFDQDFEPFVRHGLRWERPGA